MYNAPLKQWLFPLALLVCVGAVMLWRALQLYPLHDLYPLYYGGLAWRAVGNAYDLAPVVPPVTYEARILAIGNAYPLPAVLLTLPLTLLPPHAAAVLWVGLLTAGVLTGLRLSRTSYLFCLYLPLVDSVRIEQYATVVIIAQLWALWAYHERRPWALACCCALMTTKPSQGVVLALVLALLARNWREQFIAFATLWGVPLLLDPDWLGEWLTALQTYQTVADWPIQPWLALFAVPLLLVRNWIGAAVIAQLGLFPFQGTYTSVSIPLGVRDDPGLRWLVVLSYLWPVPALFISETWAAILTLILPMLALVAYRRWQRRHPSASLAEPPTTLLH